MVWTPGVSQGTAGYVAFRKQIELGDSICAEMEIFADSRYLLWINGRYVLRGPCRFNPKRPEYDVVPVSGYLRKGVNQIVVLVHHNGNNINGRIMQHHPGLGVRLLNNGVVVSTTDTSWKCSHQISYYPTSGAWSSISDYVDGRIDKQEWLLAGYDDTCWETAQEIDGGMWGKMYPREMKLLRETTLSDVHMIGDELSVSSRLPVELNEGESITLDNGVMAPVYYKLTVEGERGSEVSLSSYLRCVNGSVSERFGSDNLFVLGGGAQTFMTTDQWVCRYSVIKSRKGKVKIKAIEVVDRSYPFERLGSFCSSDEFLNRVWDMAVRTIQATADDAYGSDARERNEWVQDASKPSFMTSQVALSSTGKTDVALLKSMLRHAALSQLENGSLLGTFPTDRGPSDCHYIIEDYACQWFEALQLYYDLSGDRAFVEEMWDTAERQIELFISQISDRGLLFAREYMSFDNPWHIFMQKGLR